MHETMRLDDMRLVAELVLAKNFTEVARRLAMPKQTVSRRVAQLESGLGVRLVDRTTRSFRMTAIGRGYAERCMEVMRLADDVNRSVRGEGAEVSGTLRVTADPLFGEQFLPALIAAFAVSHPSVRLDVTLTSRNVDLIEEGFDLAFRVGAPPDPSLVATRIGGTELVFVASAGYAAKHGLPRLPEDLAAHDCIALAPEGAPVRWAVRHGASVRWISLTPRLRVNHLGLARQAVLQNLGIGNLPRFACADELRRKSLRPVLADFTAPFGAIYVVLPPRRMITPRTRLFRDLAVSQLRQRSELR